MNPNSLFSTVSGLLFTVLVGFVVVVLLLFLFYAFVLWYRWRDREKKSLELITLLVAIPQDNEVKIDATEQIIGSLSSLYHSTRFKFLQVFVSQPSLSLEIIGTHEDIKFYICIPQKYQDLVEKQIYSVYAGADVRSVDEPSLFTENGKVEYAWLGLKKLPFYPLKSYKEIPTDPLASITSVLSKLNENETTAIQMVVSPADSAWSKSGRSYISQTKKSESNPEKASYKVDARQLEAIESKSSKPGFEVALRLVSVAPSSEIAKVNLSNLKACFSQFESPWNKLSSRKIYLKSFFVDDFIYKYPVIFWWKGKTILSTDEISSIFHFPNKTIETPQYQLAQIQKSSLSSRFPPRRVSMLVTMSTGELTPNFV